MTETEKIEMLMRPRYKVVGLYPFSSYYFALNEVIELTEFDGREHLSKEQNEWYVVKQSKYNKELVSSEPMLPMTMHESAFNLYPHLFKRLSWWEERKPEEMPEYVRYAENGKVAKVNHFDLETTSAWFMYLDGGIHPYSPGGSALENTHWVPATQSEYLAYTQSPTPAQ